MQKEDYSWNPSTCICENSKYLKCGADTSVFTCDEIIFDKKKVRYKTDCYILHTVISDHITIDNYYYLLSLCKT